MIKELLRFWGIIAHCEDGGLGITQASMVSAVADNTGDDGPDAVVKIKRLINTCGPDFCMITNWDFLRDDISFAITAAGGFKYSGTDYLPATYRKTMGAHIVDTNDWHSLDERGIREFYRLWLNPANNSGRPSEFCVTRPESGFWEIVFNRKPDQSYTVEMDIEKQWVDLTATTDETVVTKPYYTAFVHYVSMARFLQQGDSENFSLYKVEWYDPQTPRNSILGRILSSLSGPMKKKQAVIRESYLFPLGRYTHQRGLGNFRNRGRKTDYS